MARRRLLIARRRFFGCWITISGEFFGTVLDSTVYGVIVQLFLFLFLIGLHSGWICSCDGMFFVFCFFLRTFPQTFIL